MTGALLIGGKSGHRETGTQRRRPQEDGDRDWSEMSRSQQTVSIRRNTRT